MQFNERLKKAREKREYTQQQVADMMNVTKSTYCGYETGRSQPDLKKLKQLAVILNTSIDELLEMKVIPPLPGLVDSQYAEEEYNIVDLRASSPRNFKNRLTTAFDSLNFSGQQVAVERVEELTEIPKYQKDPPPEDSGNG